MRSSANLRFRGAAKSAKDGGRWTDDGSGLSSPLCPGIMVHRIGLILLSMVGVLALAACAIPTGGRVIGGQPVAIGELPTYPGATELSAGQSKIIDPLFAPAQRETPPFIGLGIEVEKSQRNFSVPPEATFADIKAFYSDKLLAGGWREDPAMREFTNSANAAMQVMQGAIWVRVDQTLLVVLATDPATGQKELTLSMSTR